MVRVHYCVVLHSLPLGVVSCLINRLASWLAVTLIHAVEYVLLLALLCRRSVTFSVFCLLTILSCQLSQALLLDTGCTWVLPRYPSAFATSAFTSENPLGL